MQKAGLVLILYISQRQNRQVAQLQHLFPYREKRATARLLRQRIHSQSHVRQQLLWLLRPGAMHHGTTSSYVSIIHDCLQIFDNVPELFHLRTTYGGRTNSSLLEYNTMMGHCILQATSGSTASAWAEEGHLAAISLLYNIAIFVYSCPDKKWSVFNKNAGAGYICVISKPQHFDAVDTNNGASPIPKAAETYGITRQTIPSARWSDIQRNCKPPTTIW